MSGIHLWNKNEFSTFCIRCGYTHHVKESEQECSGDFDEKVISESQDKIRVLYHKIDLIRQASKVPFQK